MSDFSLNDWALFLILFVVSYDIRIPILFWTIAPILSSDMESRFLLAFERIVNSSAKFSKFFADSQLCVAKDVNLASDPVFLFDSSDWTYCYLQKACGVTLTDRRQKPACLYTQDRTRISIVRDYKGMIFKTVYSYLKHRITESYSTTTRKMQKEISIIPKRVIFKVHLKFICRRLMLKVRPDLVYAATFQNEVFSQKQMINNKKIQKMKKRMKMLKYRMKCDVCHKSEYYTIEEMRKDRLREEYVFELKLCPCRKLVVCGKRCHKIAWKWLGHRDVCTAKC